MVSRFFLCFRYLRIVIVIVQGEREGKGNGVYVLVNYYICYLVLWEVEIFSLRIEGMGISWIWFRFLKIKIILQFWEVWNIDEGFVDKGSLSKNGRNIERGGKKQSWIFLIVIEDIFFFSFVWSGFVCEMGVFWV